MVQNSSVCVISWGRVMALNHFLSADKFNFLLRHGSFLAVLLAASLSVAAVAVSTTTAEAGYYGYGGGSYGGRHYGVYRGGYSAYRGPNGVAVRGPYGGVAARGYGGGYYGGYRGGYGGRYYGGYRGGYSAYRGPNGVAVRGPYG